jgi:hypothetical protein
MLNSLKNVRCNSSMTCRFQTCRFLFGSLYTCRTICIQSVRTFYLEVSGKHPNGFVSKYGTVSHLRSTSFALRFVQHVPSSWKLNTHIESSREKISDRIITMLGAFGRNHPKSVTFVGVAWLSRRWELMDLAGTQEICAADRLRLRIPTDVENI